MITVLTGPNTYAVSTELRQLIAQFDGEVERIDGSELTVRQLPDIFIGQTLFSSSRMVVLHDIASNKSLWAELEKWIERTPDETHLVFVESKLDKRTRTYKLLQSHGTIIDKALLKEHEIVQWIQTSARALGITVEKPVAQFLIMHAGPEQWQLYHELQKLALTKQPVTVELIKDVVPRSSEASVFLLLDDIFAGKIEAAIEQLHILKLQEEPYRFFALLANQLYVLALATAGEGRTAADIAKAAGVHPFVAQKAQALARRRNLSEVKRMVQHIATVDHDLKSRGGDPWMLIEAAVRTLK